jgi:hypothetical protein
LIGGDRIEVAHTEHLTTPASSRRIPVDLSFGLRLDTDRTGEIR